MPASRSESFLLQLAERTFLTPWAIPGPAYKAGKEISDLVIPFGDDVIVISDKACDFEVADGPELAWSRWSTAAVDASLKQLGGALRRLEMPETRVFVDAGARQPLAFPLAPHARRRYHLVGVARPAKDPAVRPPGWSPLSYDDAAPGKPFTVGALEVRGQFVHFFDGDGINLLLERLDTAPDFIAYLASRAAALAGGGGFCFREPDLLAHATINWMQGLGYRVDGPGPTLSRRVDGLWDSFAGSERDLATAEKNRPSRLIDAMVGDFHREYLALQAGDGHPDAPNHEAGMRLLAQESRFSRRMIVGGLHDLLDEPNQATSRGLTLESSSSPGVRYVLMTFPPPRPGVAIADHDRWCLQDLRDHIIVAADRFGGDTIVGLGINNRAWDDPIRLLRVFDARDLTPDYRRQADALRARGVFADPEVTETVHIP
ncbi:hypothetical protein FFK22_018750 [Mycobacterium sp. KBS0706]|uniref:hypothetical protein n=1 Tax=Mycobacterium sp. KBS0706 TaxID=2578109 RepID=UPI00110FF069|nr:hypothetical protein [Mycobacterium sp. KBS0706]TSD87091.1 hypothetical protein FFK22_018750 [Mycobacterium sp. KBS0706]